LIQIGEHLRFANGLEAEFPLSDPESEREFAADCSVFEELKRDLRVRTAAHWLHVPLVCAYQTMLGDSSPADRMLAASYGFCTVLFMFALRQFVPFEFQPLQRKSEGSDKLRWALNDESSKKLMVTLATAIRHFGVVGEPIRADVFGILRAERLFLLHPPGL
jgi:hypothetical protein